MANISVAATNPQCRAGPTAPQPPLWGPSPGCSRATRRRRQSAALPPFYFHRAPRPGSPRGRAFPRKRGRARRLPRYRLGTPRRAPPPPSPRRHRSPAAGARQRHGGDARKCGAAAFPLAVVCESAPARGADERGAAAADGTRGGRPRRPARSGAGPRRRAAAAGWRKVRGGRAGVTPIPTPSAAAGRARPPPGDGGGRRAARGRPGRSARPRRSGSCPSPAGPRQRCEAAAEARRWSLPLRRARPSTSSPPRSSSRAALSPPGVAPQRAPRPLPSACAAAAARLRIPSVSPLLRFAALHSLRIRFPPDLSWPSPSLGVEMTFSFPGQKHSEHREKRKGETRSPRCPTASPGCPHVGGIPSWWWFPCVQKPSALCAPPAVCWWGRVSSSCLKHSLVGIPLQGAICHRPAPVSSCEEQGCMQLSVPSSLQTNDNILTCALSLVWGPSHAPLIVVLVLLWTFPTSQSAFRWQSRNCRQQSLCRRQLDYRSGTEEQGGCKWYPQLSGVCSLGKS